MTYALLYVENADVVATFDDEAMARDALNDFVSQHPHVRGEVAVLAIDDEGHGQGEYVFADGATGLFS